MKKRGVDDLVIVLTAVVCTAVMAVLFGHFGSHADFWGLLVPLLFVIFFISWKAVSHSRESMPSIPYAVLMVLISALVIVLDLGF